MKTIIYDQSGIIKNVQIGTGILEGLQELLIHYLTTLDNVDSIKNTYEKIKQIQQGSQEIKFEGVESYIYILVAIIQNLRILALEQGIAKEVEVDEAAHAKAKEAVEFMFSKDKDSLDKFNQKMKEINEMFIDINAN